MGRRKKQDEWDAADKLKVVKEYLMGNNSFVKLGRKYQLNESSIRKWVAKYKTFGENAFMIRSANLNYSAVFKEQVVKAYLHEEGSYKELLSNIKFRRLLLFYNGLRGIITMSNSQIPDRKECIAWLKITR